MIKMNTLRPTPYAIISYFLCSLENDVLKLTEFQKIENPDLNGKEIAEELPHLLEYLKANFENKTIGDKWLIISVHEMFLNDFLRRARTLGLQSEKFNEVIKTISDLGRNFYSYKNLLLIENISIEEKQSDAEVLVQIEEFFISSGYEGFEDLFYRGQFFPGLVLDKLDGQNITLKFQPHFFVSAVIDNNSVSGQLKALRFPFNFEEELIKFTDSFLEGLLAYIDNHNLKNDEDNKTLALLGKLMGIVKHVSIELNRPGVNTSKIKHFESFRNKLIVQLKKRFPNLNIDSTFLGTLPSTNPGIILNQRDANEICKSMIKLNIIDKISNPDDFAKILSLEYSGKAKIKWIAKAKSKGTNKNLLLTFLKIIADNGFLPDNVISSVKNANEYIKNRFLNNGDAVIEITAPSFSEWKIELKNDSNNLDQFCNKPSNPKRQEMFESLSQIFQNQAVNGQK
jgi:hypothetical protein